jgi:hypothetical protein
MAAGKGEAAVGTPSRACAKARCRRRPPFLADSTLALIAWHTTVRAVRGCFFLDLRRIILDDSPSPTGRVQAMLRSAVAAFLMMAQAAGSLPCCCTASRLPATARPSTPNLPACCHKASAPEQRLPQESPGKPQPGRPPCPCRQAPSGNSAIALGTEAGKHFQQRQLSQAPAGMVSLFVLDGSLPTSGSLRLDAASALPFLTTDDILHALHILRC